MFIHSGLLPLICKFNDEDAIFSDKPYQHDYADLTEDVQCLFEIPEGKQGAGYCQRDSEKDDERVNEAFKLGCKNQIDQDNSKDKNKNKAGRAFLVITGLPGEACFYV